MNKKQRLSAEEMLEAIFYDMNLLVVEKDFYNSILLLTDLGRTLVNAERASFWYRDVRKKQYWTLAALDSERITNAILIFRSGKLSGEDTCASKTAPNAEIEHK